MKGAYGAFFVTNPFGPTSCPTPDVETKQAKTFAEAAKAVGLKHAIWSTTEDPRVEVPLSSNMLPSLTRPISGGSQKDFKIPHFECKADGDVSFIENGVPTTFLMPGFYYENFFTYFPLKREDGKLSFTIPLGESKLAWISAEDIGNVCYTIFKQPEVTLGQRIGISSEHLTMSETAAKLSAALGEVVIHNKFVTAEIFRTFGFPGCEELANMFQYERDFSREYCQRRNVEETRKLYPLLRNLDAWLRDNKVKFEAQLESVEQAVGA